MAGHAENEQRSERSEGDSDFIDLNEGQCLLETKSFTDFYVRAKQSNFVILQSYDLYFSQASKQNITNLKTSNILM